MEKKKEPRKEPRIFLESLYFAQLNSVSAGTGNNEGAAGLLSAIVVPGSLSA